MIARALLTQLMLSQLVPLWAMPAAIPVPSTATILGSSWAGPPECRDALARMDKGFDWLHRTRFSYNAQYEIRTLVASREKGLSPKGKMVYEFVPKVKPTVESGELRYASSATVETYQLMPTSFLPLEWAREAKKQPVLWTIWATDTKQIRMLGDKPYMVATGSDVIHRVNTDTEKPALSTHRFIRQFLGAPYPPGLLAAQQRVAGPHLLVANPVEQVALTADAYAEGAPDDVVLRGSVARSDGGRSDEIFWRLSKTSGWRPYLITFHGLRIRLATWTRLEPPGAPADGVWLPLTVSWEFYNPKVVTPDNPTPHLMMSATNTLKIELASIAFGDDVPSERFAEPDVPADTPVQKEGDASSIRHATGGELGEALVMAQVRERHSPALLGFIACVLLLGIAGLVARSKRVPSAVA